MFIACIAYAIYQFIESYIGNGIMFVLIGLTFLFLYYKNEFILLAFLKLRKQDFAGTEAWLCKIKNPQSALTKKATRLLQFFKRNHGVSNQYECRRKVF